MKRLFCVTALVLSILSINAQDIATKCKQELDSARSKAESVWKTGVSLGLDPERANKYVTYCLDACAIVDKYIDNIPIAEDQMPILWAEIEILSDIIDLYKANKVGLTASDYDRESNRRISLLRRMAILCRKQETMESREDDTFEINKLLGEHYFNNGEYKEAYAYFKKCIGSYLMLATSPIADVAGYYVYGQEAYYWAGYAAYKLGDRATAQSYYDKASNWKSYLNNSLIKPYK